MRWRWLVPIVTPALAVFAACSSFDAGNGESPADAGPEAAQPDAEVAAEAAPTCDVAEVTDAAPSRDCLGTGQNVELDTSPLHCGRCGHSCLGGTCTGGLCDPVNLVAGKTTPVGEVTATDLYYVSGPGVHRRHLVGGADDVIAQPEPGYNVQSFVRDGDRLFVATSNGNFTGLGTVASIASGDAGIEPLFQPATAQFTVDSKNLYYVSYASILSVPRTGASAFTPVRTFPNGDGVVGPVSRDDELFWIPFAPVVDGSVPSLKLYVRLADGTIIERTDQVGDPAGLAVDATHIYWADKSTQSVLRAPRKGTSAPTVVARWPGPNRAVKALLVAGDRVYWTVSLDYQAGADVTIYEAPTCAVGATVRVTSHPGGELWSGFVADDNYLYYGGLSGVWRVPR